MQVVHDPVNTAVETAPSEKNECEKKMTKCLKEILDNYQLPIQSEGRKVIEEFATSIQRSLVDKMHRIDPLFDAMHLAGKPKITGSVRHSLKVQNFNEFDVNLGLKLLINPENLRSVRIRESNVKGCKCFYTCTFPVRAWEWPLPRKCHRKSWRNIVEKFAIKGHLDERPQKWFLLKADGIRRWLQGLVARAIKELNAENWPGKSLVKQSRSGPAITLKIRLPPEISQRAKLHRDEENKFSIDLVPVILVPDEFIPTLDGYDKDNEFHLVPALPKVPPGQPPPPTFVFRGTFPTLETKHLEDRKVLKIVIRLLKVFRNENDLAPIASYYLVNLATTWDKRMKVKQNDVDGHLQDDKIGSIFVELLEILGKALRDGYLPMTLEPELNLIANLSEQFRTNSSSRLLGLTRRLKFAAEANNQSRVEKLLRRAFVKEKDDLYEALPFIHFLFND